jgi:hypothetical protein
MDDTVNLNGASGEAPSCSAFIEFEQASYLGLRLALQHIIGSNPFLNAIRDRLITDRVLQ